MNNPVFNLIPAHRRAEVQRQSRISSNNGGTWQRHSLGTIWSWNNQAFSNDTTLHTHRTSNFISFSNLDIGESEEIDLNQPTLVPESTVLVIVHYPVFIHTDWTHLYGQRWGTHQRDFIDIARSLHLWGRTGGHSFLVPGPETSTFQRIKIVSDLVYEYFVTTSSYPVRFEAWGYNPNQWICTRVHHFNQETYEQVTPSIYPSLGTDYWSQGVPEIVKTYDEQVPTGRFANWIRHTIVGSSNIARNHPDHPPVPTWGYF